MKVPVHEFLGLRCSQNANKSLMTGKKFEQGAIKLDDFNDLREKKLEIKKNSRDQTAGKVRKICVMLSS